MACIQPTSQAVSGNMTNELSNNNEAIEEEESSQMALPLDIFQPSREVRPDYNIGKWTGVIFTSPYAKDVRDKKVQKWEYKLDDEIKLQASLTITPLLNHKRPTTTTLRVYLALVQAWEHQGRNPEGIVEFSSRQLCHLIGWRWGGKETAERIYEHLEILAGTSLRWVRAYRNKEKLIEDLKSSMSILASADYRRREELFPNERFSAMQRVRFNPDLIESMLANHVRPINYEQFQQIANDTLASLYMRLDLYLYKKPKIKLDSLKLLTKELGLTGKRYQKRFARHQKLKEMVKALDGVKLFTGTLRLSIGENKDKSDWQLVAWKEHDPAAIAPPPRRRLKPTHTDEEATLQASDLIAEIERQPQGGEPNFGYIEYLCKLYPRNLTRQALDVAKADYRDLGNVKKTLTHVFVYEVERLVKESKKLRWWKDEEGKGIQPPSQNEEGF